MVDKYKEKNLYTCFISAQTLKNFWETRSATQLSTVGVGPV
jgi:hypothetical protein